MQRYLCIMTELPNTADRAARRPHRVLDASALRALAHPLRIRIFDILSQYGPQTASTLAELTGESSGSTSYHLRALARHDLIREVEGRGTARERWWERPTGSVSFGDTEIQRTPAGRAASQAVVTEFLTQRHQQVLDYVMHADPEDTEWAEAATLSSASTRLTLDQMRTLSARIQELIDEYMEAYRDQEGEGVRLVAIRADAFPLPEEARR
jgi:DNA-binding transcriptional ArsR family regulator